MAETTSNAQFRYLPEDGVFEASVMGLTGDTIEGADEQEVSQLATRWACLNVLTDMPGVHAVRREDGIVIQAYPRRLFAESTPTETLTSFLSCISYLLPTYPDDCVDRVVGIEAACNRGVRGVIMSAYDQYQRWLENGPVGDELLRRVLAATVLPLRPELSTAELSRNFQYRAGGETEHATIGEGSLRTALSVIRGEFNDIDYISEAGNLAGPWRRVEDVYLLRHVEVRRAIGDSFGVLPSARRHFMPVGPRLYDMQSGTNSIPHPREIGGYLLAMGVLADEASRFSGGRPVSERAIRVDVEAA